MRILDSRRGSTEDSLRPCWNQEETEIVLKLTHPVTTTNSNTNVLRIVKKFMPLTPTFGKKVCRRVIKEMTTMAIPRFSHSVAVFPEAATT